MLPRIEPEQLIQHFIEDRPFIDVRANIEFIEGSLPGALNFPILTDEERAKIGKVYKQHGQEKAINLGYKIVSGEIKDQRVTSWINQIKENPQTIVYCFRGGQRSQITQKWIAEAGIQVPIVSGGYKKTRQFLMQSLTEFPLNKKFFVLTGSTGSGKSVLLRKIDKFYPTIDLEKRANHRGSAYGNLGPQPTQIDFENNMTVDFFKIQNQYLKENPNLSPMLEDESRLIGARYLPDNLFQALRASPVIRVNRTIEERTQQIYQEYIVEALDPNNETQNQQVFKKYQTALDAIRKRLGGLKHQEITKIYENSLRHHEQGNPEEHKSWIRELLIHYYDPMYTDSFKKRNPEILFQGTHLEIQEFLKLQIEKK